MLVEKYKIFAESARPYLVRRAGMGRETVGREYISGPVVPRIGTGAAEVKYSWIYEYLWLVVPHIGAGAAEVKYSWIYLC